MNFNHHVDGLAINQTVTTMDSKSKKPKIGYVIISLGGIRVVVICKNGFLMPFYKVVNGS
jgi:hypothetical protein